MGIPEATLQAEDKLYTALERYGVRSMKDLHHILRTIDVTFDPTQPVTIPQMQAALDYFRERRASQRKPRHG